MYHTFLERILNSKDQLEPYMYNSMHDKLNTSYKAWKMDIFVSHHGICPSFSKSLFRMSSEEGSSMNLATVCQAYDIKP